jgi:hypothetical protein
MMMTYFFPLLSVVALCAFWAIFQVWLSRRDPDAKTTSPKCGGCVRQDECAAAGDRVIPEEPSSSE